MTVAEMMVLCARLMKEGKGDRPIVWQSLTHVWPVEELREKNTDGRGPVFLVNP